MEKASRKKTPTVNLKCFGLAMDPGAPWPRTIECTLLSSRPGIRVIGHVNLVFSEESARFLMNALKDLVRSPPAPPVKSKASKNAKKKPGKKAAAKKRR